MRIDECLPGLYVVYHAPHEDPDTAPGELGIITSANGIYAFVRYGASQYSKATAPQNLSPAYTEDNCAHTKAAYCRYWIRADGSGLAKLECAVENAKCLECVCTDELADKLLAYQVALDVTKRQSVSGAGGTGEPS